MWWSRMYLLGHAVQWAGSGGELVQGQHGVGNVQQDSPKLKNIVQSQVVYFSMCNRLNNLIILHQMYPRWQGSLSESCLSISYLLVPTSYLQWCGSGIHIKCVTWMRIRIQLFKKWRKLTLTMISNVIFSVADPDPFDTDPDPAVHFETVPDPTIWYRSRSLPSQRGNVPKTVLFIHLYLIFLVSRSNRTYTKGTYSLLNFSFQLILLCALE